MSQAVPQVCLSHVLPFGLSLSPLTFQKCMDVVLIPLWQKGIRVFNYLDNWLVCFPSENLAWRHTEAVLPHLVALGLHLKPRGPRQVS